MQIDAREIDITDLLKQLKETMLSSIGCSISLEVLVGSKEDALKVKAFAEMSGCHKVDIDKNNSYYIMQIKGVPCCT